MISAKLVVHVLVYYTFECTQNINAKVNNFIIFVWAVVPLVWARIT